MACLRQGSDIYASTSSDATVTFTGANTFTNCYGVDGYPSSGMYYQSSTMTDCSLIITAAPTSPTSSPTVTPTSPTSSPTISPSTASPTVTTVQVRPPKQGPPPPPCSAGATALPRWSGTLARVRPWVCCTRHELRPSAHGGDLKFELA